MKEAITRILNADRDSHLNGNRNVSLYNGEFPNRFDLTLSLMAQSSAPQHLDHALTLEEQIRHRNFIKKILSSDEKAWVDYFCSDAWAQAWVELSESVCDASLVKGSFQYLDDDAYICLGDTHHSESPYKILVGTESECDYESMKNEPYFSQKLYQNESEWKYDRGVRYSIPYFDAGVAYSTTKGGESINLLSRQIPTLRKRTISPKRIKENSYSNKKADGTQQLLYRRFQARNKDQFLWTQYSYLERFLQTIPKKQEKPSVIRQHIVKQFYGYWGNCGIVLSQKLSSGHSAVFMRFLKETGLTVGEVKEHLSEQSKNMKDQFWLKNSRYLREKLNLVVRSPSSVLNSQDSFFMPVIDKVPFSLPDVVGINNEGPELRTYSMGTE